MPTEKDLLLLNKYSEKAIAAFKQDQWFKHRDAIRRLGAANHKLKMRLRTISAENQELRELINPDKLEAYLNKRNPLRAKYMEMRKQKQLGQKES